MIWKNQFLHLTNGDVSAVYGDSALFFKITQKMHVSPHQNFTIF